MVRIKPFRGIRPREDLAAQVSALPYDVMNREEAAAMAAGNQHSILRITRAEVDFPPEVEDYDDRVYARGKENLASFLQEGVLIKEAKPVFYIYRETMSGQSQTGLVAAFAAEDYENNTILKHELTRKEKEADRIRHFHVCRCQTEPVFLTYRRRRDIDAAVAAWITAHDAVYDFIAADHVRHQLWLVDAEAVINDLVEAFEKLDKAYIADGHHRTASAVAVGKMGKGHGTPGGQEGLAQSFMAVIFPDGDLRIMEYNRVVTLSPDFDGAAFLKQLALKFSVEKIKGDFVPAKKHEFGLYLDGAWYRLVAKPELYQNADAAANLDAAILQKNVLGPLLAIEDPRSDQKIDFIGGIRGSQEIVRRCAEGDCLGFQLYPVASADLMAIADKGKIMPPKSTWFEPKLRSGLFLHSLEEDTESKEK